MSWPEVAIGEVAEIVSGSTPKSSEKAYWDGEVLWATPKDLSLLNGDYISSPARNISEAGLSSCSAKLLPPGSVLLSSRAPIGLAAINTEPMATNQGFKSLVPNAERVHNKYLLHWIRSHRDRLQSLGNGATFKELPKSTVSRIEIPLPPLEEQRRIAAILDKADALRRKRREALALLDTLTQSIFVEMFGDPVSNPRSYSSTTIGDLLEIASYGTSAKAGTEGEYPVLRMGNITYSGSFDLTDLKYLDLVGSDIEKYTVKRGDILFNRTNSADLVGKTAVWNFDEPFAFAGYLVRGRTKEGVSPYYISGYLNSAHGKAVLRNMAKNIVGMANINAKELQRIKILDVPSNEQEAYERRISAVQKLKAERQTEAGVFDSLFASLQSRAFNGTL